MNNHAMQSYKSSKITTKSVLRQDFFNHCETQLKRNLEKLEALCSDVPLPRGKLEFIDYFCGRSGSAEELDAKKNERSNLMKAVNDLIVSYINIIDEKRDDENNFDKNAVSEFEDAVNYYVSIRENIYSNVLLQNHLNSERTQLDAVLKKLEFLCSEVEFPKNELNCINFFCGKSGTLEELISTEHRRQALYNNTALLLRFYIGIAEEMEAVGYTDEAKDSVKNKVDYYIQLREAVRCNVLLQTRIVKARAELGTALAKVNSLCSKVDFPKDELEHILYFCGKRGHQEDLEIRKILRRTLNKAVIDLSTAFAILQEEMESAGYSLEDEESIKNLVKFYSDLRYQMIRYESYDCNYV